MSSPPSTAKERGLAFSSSRAPGASPWGECEGPVALDLDSPSTSSCHMGEHHPRSIQAVSQHRPGLTEKSRVRFTRWHRTGTP